MPLCNWRTLSYTQIVHKKNIMKIVECSNAKAWHAYYALWPNFHVSRSLWETFFTWKKGSSAYLLQTCLLLLEIMNYSILWYNRQSGSKNKMLFFDEMCHHLPHHWIVWVGRAFGQFHGQYKRISDNRTSHHYLSLTCSSKKHKSDQLFIMKAFVS